MQYAIALSLTADRLVLDLMRLETDGFWNVLPGLFRNRAAFKRNQLPIVSVEVPGQMLAGNLGPCLAQALLDLRAQHEEALAGTPLDVQLGLDHAQIGLVDLSGVSPSSLNAKNCDAFAQAWVAQMLHTNPATAVIRWELLEHSQKLLVSSVSRNVVDTLNEFCVQSGMRFSSCRPAVLAALDHHQSRDGRAEPMLERDLAWTELSANGDRSSKVQLFRFQGRHLLALWRGWVPQIPSGDGKDVELDGAIGRFQRINSPGSGAAVKRVVWPSRASAGILT